METLSTRIKRLMESQRPVMTGRSLAVALDKDPSYVSKLINDRLMETPPPEVLQGLERVLGIPVAWSLRAWGYALDDAGAGQGSPAVTAPGPNATELLKLLPALTERQIGGLLRLAEYFGETEPYKVDEQVPTPMVPKTRAASTGRE